MLSRLFIATLWSPAGKELTFWLSFVMFNCVFVTFPCGILGQVRYRKSKKGGKDKESIQSSTTPDQEDKLSKATCSLFPIKMIAILEWT